MSPWHSDLSWLLSSKAHLCEIINQKIWWSFWCGSNFHILFYKHAILDDSLPPRVTGKLWEWSRHHHPLAPSSWPTPGPPYFLTQSPQIGSPSTSKYPMIPVAIFNSLIPTLSDRLVTGCVCTVAPFWCGLGCCTRIFIVNTERIYIFIVLYIYIYIYITSPSV